MDPHECYPCFQFLGIVKKKIPNCNWWEQGWEKNIKFSPSIILMSRLAFGAWLVLKYEVEVWFDQCRWFLVLVSVLDSVLSLTIVLWWSFSAWTCSDIFVLSMISYPCNHILIKVNFFVKGAWLVQKCEVELWFDHGAWVRKGFFISVD